ncbi:carboxylesterase/lipase family protein [Nocardioides sp.]|uniref:carboxylesterase/lipase family protein n=1 Tax=Nocardioides sp. TaxID=35761 RepID=UPI002B27AB5E|nr:carboxylesterase family protein [Nocardioides sp.]
MRPSLSSHARRDPVSTTVVAAVVAVVVTVALVASIVLVTGPSESPATSGDPLVVETTGGLARGIEQDGVRTWRGLPYAAPPVDDLRWRAPQPAAEWDDVRDASRFGASCFQAGAYEYGDAVVAARPRSSEDCLYLNVTQPAAAPAAAGLPVIVWLHGGGLIQGSGSTVDPTALAARGAVIVTINHRLGRLGYFAHPALEQDVANLGLLDQVEALEWVRDNAARFGGDPDLVTVMGGSAGAISVNALMVAPAADGLFARAISQSATGDRAARTLDDVRRQGARDFPGLSADELRALPASALLSSTFNVLLGDAPIIDEVLPESVGEAFARGHEAAVPYLVGTTDAEFSDGDYRAAGTDPARLRSQLGGTGHDALVAAYGRRAFRKHALNDLVFQAPAVALALHHADRAPTFRYRFAADRDGSGHGTDVPYVFGQEELPIRKALARAMGDYWVAFARLGEPRVGGRPGWPSASGSSYLDLGAGGPKPVARDPWTSRLAALNAAVPLRLPASGFSAARDR